MGQELDDGIIGFMKQIKIMDIMEQNMGRHISLKWIKLIKDRTIESGMIGLLAAGDPPEMVFE